MPDPETTAQAIAAHVPGFAPRAGLVLGSGLADLADAVEVVAEISYGDLEGFPQPGVEGHAGRLLAGHLGGLPVVCLAGRSHLYEGHDASALTLPIRTLKRLGCELVFLTNAAGSLNPAFEPGSLMAVSDHINMLGRNPLVGPNDDRFGPRFPDMTEAYDSALRASLKEAAHAVGVALNEGVYLALLGPNFETPAEIRAFRTLGADAVGMSTVPECLVARHCGLRVAAVSVLTNLAAGMSDEPLTHEATLTVGARGAAQMARLVPAFFSRLAGP